MLAAPRLKRIEFCVRCAGNPIAFSTCDGSSVPGRAGGAGRDGDALQVERDQQRLGLDAIEADVRRVRHARLPPPLTAVPVTPREDALLEAIAQRRESRRLRRPSLPRASSRRDAEADDAGDVLRAGAAAALLLAAGHRAGAAGAPRRIQSAPTPFGP